MFFINNLVLRYKAFYINRLKILNIEILRADKYNQLASKSIRAAKHFRNSFKILPAKVYTTKLPIFFFTIFTNKTEKTLNLKTQKWLFNLVM